MNQKQYFNREILKSMSTIEDMVGNEMMFHNIFPDIQEDYVNACNKDDIKALKQVKYKLDRTIDALRA